MAWRGACVNARQRRKNAWSRGSWQPLAATLDEPIALGGMAADREVTLRLAVTVRERGKAAEIVRTSLVLPPGRYGNVDELRDAMLRLHEASGEAASPAAGGVLLRLPGATDDWSLPDDLWLNSTPYRRSVRQVRCSLSWLSLAWLGLALAWLGLAWLGVAWLGLAWLGLGLAWAWLGLAWLGIGLAWLGWA